MARINADLLERLQEVIGSRSNTYVLIDRTARQMLLPRNLAAIVLAMERGINVTRFASDEELAEIRAVKSGTTVVRAPTASLVERSPERPRIAKRPTTTRKRGTAVFVVHGRNEKIRRAMFAFLRTIGLKPIEWIKALESTRKGAPFVGEVLDKAFSGATAVVVLLTPDDEARSKSEFLRSNDSQHERELTGQPRPNVLFEAGMAFGSHADNDRGRLLIVMPEGVGRLSPSGVRILSGPSTKCQCSGIRSYRLESSETVKLSADQLPGSVGPP